MKNRIASYIHAFEQDKLDEHYAKKGMELSLNFCPVCGLRKIYVVFDVDKSILKARCANGVCPFLYNPYDISIRGEKVFNDGHAGDSRYETRKRVLCQG